MTIQGIRLDPDKRKTHRGALVEQDAVSGEPLVITPAKPWHYAAEYPIPKEVRGSGPRILAVDVTVLHGEIAIASMASGNRLLNQTLRNAEDSRSTAYLPVDDMALCHSVIIRNGGAAGRSVAKVHNVIITTQAETQESSAAAEAGNEAPFVLEKPVIHEDATPVQLSGSASCLVITPLSFDAWAVQYERDHGSSGLAAEVRVEVTVHHGSVGIACLDPQGAPLVEAVVGVDQGRATVILELDDSSKCRALAVRNASREARSVFQIHDLNISHSVASNAAALTEEEHQSQATWAPFSAEKHSRFHDSSVRDNGPNTWPIVVTPETEWGYAVEFPVVQDLREQTPALVTIEMTVVHGQVGLGCYEEADKPLCEVFRLEEDGATVAEFYLKDFSLCRSLMVRNGPARGRSVVRIQAVSVSPGVEPAPPATLVVGRDTFSRYPVWSGRIPPGYTGDWLGVLTRGGVESSSLDTHNAEALKTERFGSYEPPTDSDLLLDWEPLLEAIEISGDKFTAVALGAGWGRWIVAAAVAAQKRGRDYHIVGVEAEPQHFAWMERHLQDNDLSPQKSRLIRAAANSYTGTCYFMVGNAAAWYGQAIVSEEQYRLPYFQAAVRDSGAVAEPTPCVDLREVFAGLDRVDYLHMDIQGSEADVLLACPDLLDERVAVVNIGTHSDLIERRLRRHFASHGWQCRYDIAMNSTFMACIEGEEPKPITVGDGVLVWENPRITGRTDIEPFAVPAIIRG